MTGPWVPSASAAVASAVVGVFVRRIEKKMADREKSRRDFELFEVRTLLAVTSLCEANALALQHGKCNGETHAALEYLQKVKREQKEFLVKQGIEHIF